MTAEIITIGDEILIGQVIDTNSAFLGSKLNEAGIAVNRITSVPDSADAIVNALNAAAESTSYVFITGGLGPTRDDITRSVIKEYFKSEFVLDYSLLEHIRKLLGNRGVELNEHNRGQALVPGNAKIIPNILGTAPGLWFSTKKCEFIFLPGVPYEMKEIFESHVLPELKIRNKVSAILHKTILTQGVPESMLAKTIEEWENNLPVNIKLAYLPSPGLVRLRLSASGNNLETIKKELDNQLNLLLKIIPGLVFGYDGDTLEAVTGALLKKLNKTLSIAESCTGGHISSLITSIPGSSGYFKGTVVAYSNEIKEKMLKVQPTSLTGFGAVSQQVVEEMVRGTIELFKTDYAIATSGIAGPTGGTPDKPVGTTWIAVGNNNKILSKRFQFGEDRGRNIVKASYSALNMLRTYITDK